MPYKDIDKRRANQRERTRAHRAKDPERYREAQRKSYEANKEKRRAKAREWYWSNRERAKEKARAYQLRSRYGLTREEADALGSTCAICGLPPRGKGKSKRLHIDHDKNTGKVRAALCNSCNCGLGYFRHDVALMKKAMDYLSFHGATRTA